MQNHEKMSRKHGTNAAQRRSKSYLPPIYRISHGVSPKKACKSFYFCTFAKWCTARTEDGPDGGISRSSIGCATFPFHLLFLSENMENTQSDSIVIIPTYNERENIEKILTAIFSLEKCFHVLVVDDGSPDGTAAIVHRLIDSTYPGRLFIQERVGKLGLGTAYIAGFKWALRHDYDYIFEMDADFSHDPADLPRLYEACAVKGYDLAIGSRYVSGVNVVNWPMSRVLMSYFASLYVRFITGFHVHDTTAGFKCYRRRVLETIHLDEVHFKGYAFQIEMKYTTYKIGFKITEVPVVFVNRREGESKMSGGIFGEAFFGVLRLRWEGWFRKYPALPVDAGAASSA